MVLIKVLGKESEVEDGRSMYMYHACEELYFIDKTQIRPQGYGTFSILNSAEQEIYPAHKC